MKWDHPCVSLFKKIIASVFLSMPLLLLCISLVSVTRIKVITVFNDLYSKSSEFALNYNLGYKMHSNSGSGHVHS